MIRALPLLFFALLTCSGCYSLTTFHSDTGDIDGGYFLGAPKYVIIFSALPLLDSASVEHRFNSPPPAKMYVSLNFIDSRDVGLLEQHNARAHLIIRDDSDSVVFENSGAIKSNAHPGSWESWVIGTGRRPPPDWSYNLEGAALDGGTVRFSPGGSYRLWLEIALDGPLPRTVSVYPMLQGPYIGGL